MPVVDENGLACWVGMDSDITEMVQTQAALRFANEELESFSHAVSHDIRAPLVTVQGFCRLLLQRADTAGTQKVRHWVERIHAGAEHLGQLVDGLTALTRVKGTMRLDRVDLSAMAQGIFERLR